MELIEISSPKHQLFARAMKLYTEAFPPVERREYSDHLIALNSKDFHMCAICHEQNFAGIVFYWEWPEYIYLEHLAIAQDMRCKGLGGMVIKTLEQKNKTIVLEMEPPENNEIEKKNRLIFYENRGFKYNNMKHIKLQYRTGDENCASHVVLSYPKKLNDASYKRFYKFLRTFVTCNKREKKLVIRKLKLTDDLLRASELIYNTDENIFSYLFDNFHEGRDILRDMMLLKTIYSCENITVAMLGKSIVGMVVAVKTPIKFNKKEYALPFENKDSALFNRFEKIFNDYFLHMESETDGIYISNLCVAEGYRGRGIAHRILSQLLNDQSTYILECCKNNEKAIKIFKSFGFDIDTEYVGPLDTQYYKMIKRPKTDLQK